MLDSLLDRMLDSLLDRMLDRMLDILLDRMLDILLDRHQTADSCYMFSACPRCLDRAMAPTKLKQTNHQPPLSR